MGLRDVEFRQGVIENVPTEDTSVDDLEYEECWARGFFCNHALSCPCGSIPSREAPARFPLIAAEFPLIDAKTAAKAAFCAGR